MFEQIHGNRGLRFKVDGYFSCVPVLCRDSDGRHVGLQMAVLETGQFAPSLEESSAVSVQYCRRVY